MSSFDFVIDLLSALQAKVHDMPLLFVAFTMIVYWAVMSYYHGQTRKLKHIPSMTSDLPFLSYLGTFRFLINTTEMLTKSAKKWPGAAFKVPDLFHWVVIVSPKHLEEIYKAPDTVFSSKVANNEEVQVEYTLGASILGNPYHIPILRNQLTAALPLLVPEFYDEIVAAYNDFIPITQEWQDVLVADAFMKVAARASNRTFVGLPLCRDPDFLDLNVQFTVDVVKMVLIFRMVPRFLRPIVNYLMPMLSKRIEHALRHLAPLIHTRRQEREQKGHEKPLDVLTWLMDTATGEESTDRSLARRILMLNFTAVHTSSITFTQAFYYLATFPEYMQPLREEVEEIVSSEGWTKAGLDKMHKVDSFIRESQRLNPIQDLQIMRVAMQDFTLSDGTVIPRGTSVAISAQDINHNDEVYEDPSTFDPFRFSKMTGSSNKQYGMISSNRDHLAFSIGRHICPGRHFAACEMKLMLAHIVVTYDVKLEVEGVRPQNSHFMTARFPNPNARVLFRKRRDP